MKTSLPSEDLAGIFKKLKKANHRHGKWRPGPTTGRQPVHTVYGGAHLFKAGTAAKMGDLALRSLKQYAPGPEAFATALGLSDTLANKLYPRVEEKLKREAVEDFRVDFEDGFGHRPDQEEDETAVQAAKAMAEGMSMGTLSPFCGIRIKTLSDELKNRSIRTLDLFLCALLDASGGTLPNGFVVTLPKITSRAQVRTLERVFRLFEKGHGLPQGTLKMEFMVETTESLIDEDGQLALPGLLSAAKGRCVAAHFGTYDYTASIDITAAYQTMDHPACDFAKHMMKIALSNTGLWLSDGATNIMPVGPHSAKGGKTLNSAQLEENRAVIHRAWQMSYGHIRHSLKQGFYQGWDLHPAQLPIRYAAVFGFFLEGLEQASNRLKNFMNVAAKATLSGDVFDDAATGQGLLNYFLRALNCGAVTMEEVAETGLSQAEIETRSFSKILANRRG